MGSWATEPSARELTRLDAGEVASGRRWRMTILRSSGPVPVASPATVLRPQAAPPRCPLQRNDAARAPRVPIALRLPAATLSHWSAPRRPGDAPPGDARPTPPPGPQRAWDVAFLVARRRLGVSQEGLTWKRVFCSPNASRDSEPELTLQDQLRELQQRREERRLQRLRAGRQALPDRVPTLLSAGAPPARPAPSGEPGTVPGVLSAALRRPEPALALYKVDLLDLPDALLPHLPALVGAKLLMVLGSMVALMPQDTPDYQQRLQERLWDDCRRRAPAAPRLPKAATSQRGPANGTGRTTRIFRPRSTRCSETCGSSAPRSPRSSAPGATAATSTWLAPPTQSPLFSIRFWSRITASPRALKRSAGPPPPLGLVSLGAPISFVFRKVVSLIMFQAPHSVFFNVPQGLVGCFPLKTCSSYFGHVSLPYQLSACKFTICCSNFSVELIRVLWCSSHCSKDWTRGHGSVNQGTKQCLLSWRFPL